MLLFAITGFTLNHAGDIEAKARIAKKTATLPPAILEKLAAEIPQRNQKGADQQLPELAQNWLEQNLKIDVQGKNAEWTPEEIYVALPRPGGDAWLRIDMEDGALEYEKTERGVIAYLNDLHKGRNTGKAWSWFIDLFAAACLIFCITGLFLLKMHANSRVLTWPLVGLGFVLPLLLAVLFIH